MRYFIILLSVLVFSCQTSEDQRHDHEENAGHLHANVELPVLDYTIWTESLELFVEFPALVVGETSQFAAHFTVLKGHEPVRKGSVTVSLISGKKGIRHTVDSPSSPGIFTPSLQPKEPGVYQLVFEIKTPEYTDEITLKDITVFASKEEAQGAVKDESTGNSISFLKEQAWKSEFETTPVRRKEFYPIISTSGTWKAMPNSSHVITASVAGRIQYGVSTLTAGFEVKSGQELMTINSTGLTSKNLASQISEAKAKFEQAEANYQRKKELFEMEMTTRTALENTEKDYKVSKSRYETLLNGFGTGGKKVKANTTGYIKDLMVSNGEYVEEGDELLTIVSSKNRMLEIPVSSHYSEQLQDIHNLWYKMANNHWKSLINGHGRILSVDKSVNQQKPLISIYAEVNDTTSHPFGGFAAVQVAYGTPAQKLVVPKSCLLESYGKYSVVVQLSGEEYELRKVIIGEQNGGEVAITSGLSPGEMVVTKGAYQVKMVSMSGQTPAHGHSH